MSLFSVLGYGDSSGQGWNRKHRLPRVPHDDGTESNDDDDDYNGGAERKRLNIN